MKFVITTQIMENYGAHTGDGKFSSGNAYWKMKGGTDYVVEGLTRIQDAVAFVMAKFSENDLGYKEFPVKFSTFEEWEDALLIDTDQDYRDYITSQLVYVSPN
jgi:hypothetical protein